MGEEKNETAGPGKHPSGETEGKQSRNPDRMEAQGDPKRPPDRRLSESHQHHWVGQSPSWALSLSGSQATVGAQETKDHETMECLLEHSNSGMYLPP